MISINFDTAVNWMISQNRLCRYSHCSTIVTSIRNHMAKFLQKMNIRFSCFDHKSRNDWSLSQKVTPGGIKGGNQRSISLCVCGHWRCTTLGQHHRYKMRSDASFLMCWNDQLWADRTLRLPIGAPHGKGEFRSSSSSDLLLPTDRGLCCVNRAIIMGTNAIP